MVQILLLLVLFFVTALAFGAVCAFGFYRLGLLRRFGLDPDVEIKSRSHGLVAVSTRARISDNGGYAFGTAMAIVIVGGGAPQLGQAGTVPTAQYFRYVDRVSVQIGRAADETTSSGTVVAA